MLPAPPTCSVCCRPFVEPHACEPPKQESDLELEALELEVIVAEMIADKLAERVADRLSFRAVRREVIGQRVRAGKN